MKKSKAFHLLLVVGLSSFIILLSQSCRKTDSGPLISLELYYVNNSSKPIVISHYGSETNPIHLEVPQALSIQPSDTARFYSISNLESADDVTDKRDFDRFLIDNRLYDSVYVAFDDEKFIAYSRESSDASIFYLMSYNVINPEKNKFKFYYSFSEADYKKATPIEK